MRREVLSVPTRRLSTPAEVVDLAFKTPHNTQGGKLVPQSQAARPARTAQ